MTQRHTPMETFDGYVSDAALLQAATVEKVEIEEANIQAEVDPFDFFDEVKGG